MTIIEQTLVAKNPAAKSEDGIVVTDNYIAVLDGSTSKTDRRHSFRMSNGRYAMTIVANYIRRMPADASCHQFCMGVTAAVRKRYLPFWRNKQKVLERLRQHPEERLCASGAIYSKRRREIWLVGDCQCLVDGEFYENPKPYEQSLAEQRAANVQQLLNKGMRTDQLLSNDIARAAVIPQMLEAMKGQNVTYAVIDGFPIPEQKVVVITLDFQPREVVLATDGYPFLYPTLQESEQRLLQQRETDPLNIGQFKATKAFKPGYNSFDDRTYIRFRV